MLMRWIGCRRGPATEAGPGGAEDPCGSHQEPDWGTQLYFTLKKKNKSAFFVKG
jgi:hypothetical protein